MLRKEDPDKKLVLKKQQSGKTVNIIFTNNINDY